MLNAKGSFQEQWNVSKSSSLKNTGLETNPATPSDLASEASSGNGQRHAPNRQWWGVPELREVSRQARAGIQETPFP